ncbi:hypothetical protein BDN70DRAFT_993508 [Pholiota conissans]|uniref:G domain-containing protein n=1 Tax=Pholiota conissans TaxID=109636 RepID=A0A9P5Z3T7_9AGAR|nr:hypothetical protein BDN70DRAFT_993508 [Pholiota conissans]
MLGDLNDIMRKIWEYILLYIFPQPRTPLILTASPITIFEALPSTTPSPPLPPITTITNSDIYDTYRFQGTPSRFRILVIGRADCGKTTLLQRVCNTTEDPCIYDDKSKDLLEPTLARGVHDINRPFAFKSNPRLIFHDSPDIEAGDEMQLQEVLSFLEERTKATDVNDQVHAIWFCIVLNNCRPLFPKELEFFRQKRAGNVPTIVIFTGFDDLITQIYDIDLTEHENRRIAELHVEEHFRRPLQACISPPCADVCFDDKDGFHQDQVNILIEKTTSSLDDIALKSLLISAQNSDS